MSTGPYDARIVRQWTWGDLTGWTLTLQRETGPLRWNACRAGRCVGNARTPWGALWGAWRFYREERRKVAS